MVVENVSSDAVRNGTVNARLDRVKLLRWPWHMANIITVLSKPLHDHLCVVDLKTAWIWCSSQERKRCTLWQWLPKVAVLANMWPFQRGLDRHDGILCISLHRLDLMPMYHWLFLFLFFAGLWALWTSEWINLPSLLEQWWSALPVSGCSCNLSASFYLCCDIL